MKIDRLQTELEKLYRLSGLPCVNRFLISSKELTRLYPNARPDRAQVLFQEKKGEIRLAVYVGDQILFTFPDFCKVAEELSHFLYLIWNAENNRQVSLLDVELQGEIDKYLLARQYFPEVPFLWARMFEKFSFDSTLPPADRERYREANRLGGKFCRAVEQRWEKVDLRTFYRAPSTERRALIERL